jgi:predicted nucleic acid-binding protein
MSVAELRAGARMAHWGARKSVILEDFIRGFEIIHSDDDTCWLWAELRADCRSIGREMSAQDAWIAATAIALDAPLATNNRRDYEHIDTLQLFDL